MQGKGRAQLDRLSWGQCTGGWTGARGADHVKDDIGGSFIYLTFFIVVGSAASLLLSAVLVEGRSADHNKTPYHNHCLTSQRALVVLHQRDSRSDSSPSCVVSPPPLKTPTLSSTSIARWSTTPQHFLSISHLHLYTDILVLARAVLPSFLLSHICPSATITSPTS